MILKIDASFVQKLLEYRLFGKSGVGLYPRLVVRLADDSLRAVGWNNPVLNTCLSLDLVRQDSGTFFSRKSRFVPLDEIT